MSFVAKKCGIQLQPPSIILIYEDQVRSNIRKRIMPVRNFSKYSVVVDETISHQTEMVLGLDKNLSGYTALMKLCKSRA